MLMWFILGIALLGIELMSFGLISIWFAIGAFVTMFFTHLDILTQFYIFVGVSVISLVLIRKMALKVLNKSKEVDRVTKATVKIQEKKENGNYTVYMEGKYWDCISESNFEVGDLAYVERFEGNKLVLKPLEKKKED